MIQVIVETHAAPLNAGGEFQNYTTTNEIAKGSKEGVFTETGPSTFSVSKTLLSTDEPTPSPLRIPRPFVLWWSTVTGSILQLLRQRSPIREAVRPTIPYPILNVTQIPNKHDEDGTNDVNNTAAELDTIIADSPTTFEEMPTNLND